MGEIEDSSSKEDAVTKYPAREKVIGVLLSRRAYDFIVRESETSRPVETGGILVGKIVDQYACIEYATGPGPKAKQRPNMFTRDGDYAQAELDAIYSQHEGIYDYLGEWHSHPRPGGLSKLDHKSLARIANNVAFRQPHPLLLIHEYTSLGIWCVHIFLWTGSNVERLNHRIE